MEMNYGTTVTSTKSNNNINIMEQQQNQTANPLATGETHNNTVVPTYNGYNYQYHQDYTQEMKNESTAIPMEYIPSASSAADTIIQNIPLQQPQFLPENEVTAYLNSTAPPSTTYTEVDQHEMYRTCVSSVYSNSSWESFADDSSHTTELSQEEIFEEIQRECAEIERKSQSPKMQKVSSRSKKSRASRKLDAEERKKELNRVAAAKYREKRRIERESMTVELDKLESRNRKLRSEASGLENEIKYLRDLIKEIRQRNGEP
uniref:BZIP domain-containing protein n=1 Tax=Panagrolaimus sp. ES5 TaxID=591445 RepID=A0AC34FBC5_9BILA